MVVDGVCNFQRALKVASSSVMSRYCPLCFVMILNRDFVKGSAGKFTFHLSINLRPQFAISLVCVIPVVCQETETAQIYPILL